MLITSTVISIQLQVVQIHQYHEPPSWCLGFRVRTRQGRDSLRGRKGSRALGVYLWSGSGFGLRVESFDLRLLGLGLGLEGLGCGRGIGT